jgi:hypothetical protein
MVVLLSQDEMGGQGSMNSSPEFRGRVVPLRLVAGVRRGPVADKTHLLMIVVVVASC